MRLRSRLILQGAVVPIILLAAALGVAGVLFDRSLHQAIDRALLTQAGIESVSLFDRADAPHLHLSTSPMDVRVRELAPVAALYAPDGRRLVVYPVGAAAPAALKPAGLPSEPALSTEVLEFEHPDRRSRRRVLKVRVDATDGQPYALWLAASLERHDRSVREFWRVSGLSVIVSLLVLLGLQMRNSEVLHRRLLRLQAHMTRLRAGELSSRPDTDTTGDVVSELRDAIAEATARLEQASEVRDRLVANAAHELRTPLTVIKARVDVARRRSRDVATLEATLDEVSDEVDRLAALARQLLDLASVRVEDTTKLEPVAFGDVVESSVEQSRMLLESRNISVGMVGLEGPVPSPLMVRGSALRLRQAVDNLLDNAGKFAPPGSVVDVKVGVEGDFVRLEVIDRGPGLGGQDPEVLFEPFSRGVRGADGTGLGLAIVREVAEAHGGRVRAYDNENMPGARFVFEVLKARLTKQERAELWKR